MNLYAHINIHKYIKYDIRGCKDSLSWWYERNPSDLSPFHSPTTCQNSERISRTKSCQTFPKHLTVRVSHHYQGSKVKHNHNLLSSCSTARVICFSAAPRSSLFPSLFSSALVTESASLFSSVTLQEPDLTSRIPANKDGERERGQAARNNKPVERFQPHKSNAWR